MAIVYLNYPGTNVANTTARTTSHDAHYAHSARADRRNQTWWSYLISTTGDDPWPHEVTSAGFVWSKFLLSSWVTEQSGVDVTIPWWNVELTFDVRWLPERSEEEARIPADVEVECCSLADLEDCEVMWISKISWSRGSGRCSGSGDLEGLEVPSFEEIACLEAVDWTVNCEERSPIRCYSCWLDSRVVRFSTAVTRSRCCVELVLRWAVISSCCPCRRCWCLEWQ